MRFVLFQGRGAVSIKQAAPKAPMSPISGSRSVAHELGRRDVLFVACEIDALAVLWLASSPIRQLRAMRSEAE
jgi:hypothetical protein